MAFSTIQGSGGAPDSFVGTSGVDTITLINSLGNFFLGAQEANDVIGFASTGLTDAAVITGASIRAGSGDDVISGFGGLGGFFNGVFFNGNAGADLFNFGGNQLAGSTIQGGQGDDTINTGVLTSTLVNGNRDDDTINVNANAANSSIFGGQGDDTITIGFGVNVTGSVVAGNDDNDTITTLGISNLAGSTFLGGAGDDTIDLSTVPAAAPGLVTSGVLIDGGDGDDALLGTGNADTILGGAGNDVITGGLGADIMTGGGGSNNFAYTAQGETGVVATGVIDLITDLLNTDVISGFGVTGAAGFITTGGATADANYAAALATANGLMAVGGGDEYVLAAYGTAAAGFTAVLFTDTADTGAAVGAIQIGATGAFATELLAMNAITAGQILV